MRAVALAVLLVSLLAALAVTPRASEWFATPSDDQLAALVDRLAKIETAVTDLQAASAKPQGADAVRNATQDLRRALNTVSAQLERQVVTQMAKLSPVAYSGAMADVKGLPDRLPADGVVFGAHRLRSADGKVTVCATAAGGTCAQLFPAAPIPAGTTSAPVGTPTPLATSATPVGTAAPAGTAAPVGTASPVGTALPVGTATPVAAAGGTTPKPK
jgi:hypothetical protein